jgi:hypothetical protein
LELNLYYPKLKIRADEHKVSPISLNGWSHQIDDSIEARKPLGTNFIGDSGSAHVTILPC